MNITRAHIQSPSVPIPCLRLWAAPEAWGKVQDRPHGSWAHSVISQHCFCISEDGGGGVCGVCAVCVCVCVLTFVYCVLRLVYEHMNSTFPCLCARSRIILECLAYNVSHFPCNSGASMMKRNQVHHLCADNELHVGLSEGLLKESHALWCSLFQLVMRSYTFIKASVIGLFLKIKPRDLIQHFNSEYKHLAKFG